MGGCESVLCALRFSDYIHSAGGAREAALLPQFLRTQGAAHLAGVFAGAGGVLSECSVVHWFTRSGSHQDSAVVGLRLVSAEHLSSCAAALHRSHVVASHRGAVLLSVGATGAPAAAAMGAGIAAGGC